MGPMTVKAVAHAAGLDLYNDDRRLLIRTPWGATLRVISVHSDAAGVTLAATDEIDAEKARRAGRAPDSIHG